MDRDSQSTHLHSAHQSSISFSAEPYGTSDSKLRRPVTTAVDSDSLLSVDKQVLASAGVVTSESTCTSVSDSSLLLSVDKSLEISFFKFLSKYIR